MIKMSTQSPDSTLLKAPTLEEAFDRIQVLVKDFQANENYYLSPGYQEQEVRADFINKFFIALGWDVNHDIQKNPFAQEVKVERNVNVHGAQKRSDYAFYIDPNFRDPRFYAEAKKPLSDIATPDNYFQTIRYGWCSQTPLAALTDFVQFHVLDCRYKPDIETALQRAVKKYHYSDFADREKFAEVFYLFSRGPVGEGSLEKFSADLPKARGKAVQRGLFKGGYQSMDESFLVQLDDYRETLARVFKNNNPELDGETLTEVTQRTLDRLVFLRFLEDKLIEPEPIVTKLGEKGSPWKEFIGVSRRFDGIYNGIVFKKHSVLDSPRFKMDDAQFGDICEGLSHVNSPYAFNLIPIHILGSIYERFLGKVIVATDKRARLENKPEFRKAEGVYYTPEFIVRYIVDNTVGKLIEGKTPSHIAEMRFADIACGSGSFLLGIYDLLLRYHTKYYNENSSKAKESDCIKRDGALHLSLRKKREILLNNIFGVDIDSQAVEVAQLSLYLKLLEDETTASTHGRQLALRETLLPSLNKNVVCGNSLICTDILEGYLFAKEDERKLNPMNFTDRFPEIMKQGGFTAIIGNPPYGLVENEQHKRYFEQHYTTTEGRFDTYELFIERAISLCLPGGLVSYIVPSPLLSNMYTRKLRRYLLKNCSIKEITNFGMDVFADPTIHTCIFILSNRKPSSQNVWIRKQVSSVEELRREYDYAIPQEDLVNKSNSTFDIFFDPTTSKIINKIQNRGRPLGSICYIRQCIKTGDDKKYVCVSNSCPGVGWKKSLRGKSIRRYITTEHNLWVKYGSWLARNWKNKSFYETPKIAIREAGERIIATIDLENRYFLSSLYAIYPQSVDDKLDLSFLLGIINSKFGTYFVKKVALELTKGAFTKFRTNQLARLSIPTINIKKACEKAQHDQLVHLVNQIMQARRLLLIAKIDKDKDYYEAKCESLDRQIDSLVYELYGLTESEIKLVEESST
jgi:type I restriction-modification system DNA methylase subunit